jgi:hypothetical protein
VRSRSTTDSRQFPDQQTNVNVTATLFQNLQVPLSSNINRRCLPFEKTTIRALTNPSLPDLTRTIPQATKGLYSPISLLESLANLSLLKVNIPNYFTCPDPVLCPTACFKLSSCFHLHFVLTSLGSSITFSCNPHYPSYTLHIPSLCNNTSNLPCSHNTLPRYRLH